MPDGIVVTTIRHASFIIIPPNRCGPMLKADRFVFSPFDSGRLASGRLASGRLDSGRLGRWLRPATMAIVAIVTNVAVSDAGDTDVSVSNTRNGKSRPAESKPVDFNRDVRAILSDKCFLCHGPDESSRQADLRLDRREDAIDAGAIVDGDAPSSEMIARILSDDPDLVMPPPETGKPITESELAVLKSWIDDGAKYDVHWAFQPPQKPTVPAIADDAFSRNDIDRFVLRRMTVANLSPSQPADARTLARRLSFDLTGLPPTPNDLATIDSADDTEAAIAEYADRLFASPHFGERWARWWLDAARYADSAGYEKDLQREVFFYRDWVIEAMNRDMPYDEFVISQIAGDLLPAATQDDRVATGFLRNSMSNEEGGADPEQFRVEGMFDRVDAIGKAILGITTQCAQCHTHKYDPLSHQEYYQLFAALNDFEEGSISVYTPEQARQRDDVLNEIRRHEDHLKASIPDWKNRVAVWAEKVRDGLPRWQTIHPETVPFEGQKFKVLDDGSVVSCSYAPTKAENTFTATIPAGKIELFRLEALTHDSLPRGGPGRSVDGTAALSEFRVRIEPSGGEPFDVKFVRAYADVNAESRELKPRYRNREPDKDHRTVGSIGLAIDGDIETAWTTDVGSGRSNVDRHAFFIPEAPITLEQPATISVTIVQKHGGWNSDDNQNFLLGRYRFSFTSDDASLFDDDGIDAPYPATLATTLQTDPNQWSDEQYDAMFSWWRRLPLDDSKDRTDVAAKIEAAWKRYPETASQLVAKALDRPRPTFVYDRGDFLQPTIEVRPEAPEFLGRFSNPGEPDRLRLARWLVSDDSPTAARVIVNRIWQAYFGRGLIDTPEDLGYQSSPPSHPKLLDYLATELMDRDWSLNHIHRLIIDSATYRQTSMADPQSWRADPDNRMLARGPRFRMEAEMVRDLALDVAGMLDKTIGGPSAYPPAPEFLFVPPASYGPKIWNTGENAMRRSLYVHQYRSVPYPPLRMFDAPKGDVACVRRTRSNTPMQALVMLNEPQFVDAARGLAARMSMAADERGPDAALENGFEWCTARRPNTKEQQILSNLLNEQIKRFADAEPAVVADVLGLNTNANANANAKTDTDTGTGTGTGTGTAIDAGTRRTAAWVVVARTILNLDETITKY